MLSSLGGGSVTKSYQTLATPWTLACQAPLSMGFSRQKFWSGLPFPFPSLGVTGYIIKGSHGDSDSKEFTCNVGDLGSIPGLGRSSGGGHGKPLQYSFLENSMDRGP